MVPKLIALAACTLVLITLGLVAQQQTPWAERNSLKEVVRRTKAEGKNNVKVMGPVENYAGRNIDFSTALESFNLITAEVVDHKSYVVDTDTILTWYKFRQLETISAKPTCSKCITPPDIPTDAKPMRTDEFVVITSGGTLNMDGVDVTVENLDLPPFAYGQKYLLFVSFTPSKTALIAGGPSGIFQIKRDDELDPIDNWNRPIAKTVNNRFGRKLSVLKFHIKP